MRYFKKLVGKKVYLSPINVDDYNQYCEWINDLGVSLPIGLATKNVPLHTEKELLINLSKEHSYAIVTLKDNELLGNCGLTDINHLHKTATLGIFIGNKSNRNKGFGSEAIELILNYGFKILNLNNIMLQVYSFNELAIHAYKKLGFKTFGTRSESYIVNDIYYDTIYMQILKRDFKSDLLKEKINKITT